LSTDKKPLLKSLFHAVLFHYTRAIEYWRAGARYLKLNLFYERFRVVQSLSAGVGTPKRPRVLVCIVHITSEEEHADRSKAGVKIDRLTSTLEGLLCGLSHCHLSIRVVTMAGRHVTQYLRADLQQAIVVQEESGCDPMFIGYRAQEILLQGRGSFDWFLFIEDDIQITDACMLDKLARFSSLPGMSAALLMPNRYEMYQGVKRYIDFTPFRDLAWNRLSITSVDGFKVAECTNPHSGLFCLSAGQMEIFARSPKHWFGKDVFGGPRESAATFSLMECFRMYKPHPDNLHYLECRHIDTKYSQLYPESSEYTRCPTAAVEADSARSS
jgi:hypothetical protein